MTDTKRFSLTHLTLSAFAFFSCTTSALAWSDFKSRNEAAFGFTDNATLVEQNKESDLFFRLSSANRTENEDHQLVFRFSFTKYFIVNEADVLNWRVSDRISQPDSDWQLSTAVLGQHYTSGELGTTENSFDFIALQVSADKDVELDDFLFNSEFAYQLRRFLDFDGRTDHRFFLHPSLEREFTERLSGSLWAELGLLVSSLSAYNQIFLEVGGQASFRIDSLWTWTTDLSLRNSSFLDRSVTDETPIYRNRGRRAFGLETQNEAHSLLGFGVEFIRTLSEVSLAGFSLNQTIQSSRSGLQDYGALELLARAQITF